MDKQIKLCEYEYFKLYCIKCKTRYYYSYMASKSIDPKEKDLELLKHILTYLNNTKQFKLNIRAGPKNDLLKMHVDVSHVDRFDDGHSRSVILFKLNGNVLCWSSKNNY